MTNKYKSNHKDFIAANPKDNLKIIPEANGCTTENRVELTGRAIAHNVLRKYGIIPESLTLIQGGGIKTVWKLRTGGRHYCLKRLKQTYDKALFSVNAQIHIKNSGGLVPGVILNTCDEPLTQYNDQLFVMYEWIVGRDLNFYQSHDLQSAVRGLAHFHIASRGYTSVEGARISTKLGKWPEQYETMKRKMLSWKDVAGLSTSTPQHSAYLAHIDGIISTAERALQMLSMSKYTALTEQESPSIVLCHQDYGKGNALATEKGICVLDLDGVTFDLPARDLRKIIGKNAENSGQWSTKAVSDILGWYTDVNPLNADEINVLYADLTYPHWFYGLVKNLYQNGKTLKSSEIERTARLELSKEEVLKLCFGRSD